MWKGFLDHNKIGVITEIILYLIDVHFAGANLSFLQTRQGQLGLKKNLATPKSGNGSRIKETQTNVPRGVSIVERIHMKCHSLYSQGYALILR